MLRGKRPTFHFADRDQPNHSNPIYSASCNDPISNGVDNRCSYTLRSGPRGISVNDENIELVYVMTYAFNPLRIGTAFDKIRCLLDYSVRR